MLEATIKEASTLKRLLDAVKELVTDGNFECNDEGIHLQAMDNSHVALVSASLRSEGFDSFRCDRPITLGVNLASLTKVIKCAKDDDEVALTAADSADNLQLVYNAKASDRVATYDVKLMDIDQETLTIPDTEYDATVSMPSAEFARLCRDLSALGESVAIEVSKEGVRFTCEGDAANGTVLLKADPSGGRHSGGSGSKTKVKTEEEEDARMDEDASEDDGGEKDDEDEDEEETSKKRKRTKSSSEKAPKGKTKKARKGGEDDAEAQGVQILMSQQVTLTFSIKYLLNFAKSSNLCSRVTLSLSNDVPLMVQYDFGQGVIKYFLAPKLTDS